MNTPLPVKARSSQKSAILAAQQKAGPDPQNSHTKTGKSHPNLGLRYPKDLEHCFVLGNN